MMMLLGKAHIIGYSPNECIVMSYYLLPPVTHHQQVYLFSFHKHDASDLWLCRDCDWPIKSQIQISSLANRMFEL